MDITGVLFEIKAFTNTTTARQMIDSINPSWTTEEYRTYNDTLQPGEQKSIPCGKKLTFLWASSAVDYAIDAQATLSGSVLFLPSDGETDPNHTLNLTAKSGGDPTKVRVICVD